VPASSDAQADTSAVSLSLSVAAAAAAVVAAGVLFSMGPAQRRLIEGDKQGHKKGQRQKFVWHSQGVSGVVEAGASELHTGAPQLPTGGFQQHWVLKGPI
jgi:hypothetical protein